MRKIEDLIESLVGAAKEAWLKKWSNWIESLFDAYDIEDPKVLGYSPDVLEDFLLEYCHGLTESECVDRIERLIREYGGRKKLEKIGEALEDYINYVERSPRGFCAKYGFPSDVCDKLLELRSNPCLDRDKARDVLRVFLTEVAGLDREYVEVNARRIAEELVPERKCVSWDQVLVSTSSLLRWVVRKSERGKQRSDSLRPVEPKPAPRSEKIDLMLEVQSIYSEIQRNLSDAYEFRKLCEVERYLGACSTALTRVERIFDLLTKFNAYAEKLRLAGADPRKVKEIRDSYTRIKEEAERIRGDVRRLLATLTISDKEREECVRTVVLKSYNIVRALDDLEYRVRACATAVDISRTQRQYLDVAKNMLSEVYSIYYTIKSEIHSLDQEVFKYGLQNIPKVANVITELKDRLKAVESLINKVEENIRLVMRRWGA
ncbi:MAG: hypothetical protein QXW41_08030 [Fervidicoccaceae archaeon]